MKTYSQHTDELVSFSHPTIEDARGEWMKSLLTFRLRTLLAIVTVACLLLAVRHHVQRFRLIAHEHHYSALQTGYRAMSLQNGLFDRQTMESVYPLWKRSIEHSLLADHYLQVTKQPWILFRNPPDPPTLKNLPVDDAELSAWWQDNVAAHVELNGLNCNWGSYSDRAVDDRNIALLNVNPSSFNRFLALSHPELFAEQPEYLPTN